MPIFIFGCSFFTKIFCKQNLFVNLFILRHCEAPTIEEFCLSFLAFLPSLCPHRHSETGNLDGQSKNIAYTNSILAFLVQRKVAPIGDERIGFIYNNNPSVALATAPFTQGRLRLLLLQLSKNLIYTLRKRVQEVASQGDSFLPPFTQGRLRLLTAILKLARLTGY